MWDIVRGNMWWQQLRHMVLISWRKPYVPGELAARKTDFI